jgi:hypothetical protein
MVSDMIDYEVRPIQRQDCTEYILCIHYARRWPSISFAFGLFKSNVLCGVVTYGTPPSSTLRRGLAGDDFKNDVLELNRLCLRNNTKNEASMLIGRSLKLLPSNKIIVSFADTSKGHSGIVYQATNFLYCGLTAKRTDWKIKGKEHLHSQTIVDEFRGFKNRSKLMHAKYGDDLYLENRSRKHRYVTFTGDKRFKRKALRLIKYPITPYPIEGENTTLTTYEKPEVIKINTLEKYFNK